MTAPPEAPAAESTVTSRPALETAPTIAPVDDSESIPESMVQVSLEPLVTGIHPGGHFAIAAHFRIAKGYRIGWKFPGEVGSATTVTFHAPPGFEVGPSEFPAPERYTAQGNYVGFGYENETAVFAEITAKRGLRSDEVSRFDMDASWVACRKECASERTSAFVELATTYGAARAADVEKSLAPFRARVPAPFASSKEGTQEWSVGDRDATLVARLPGATVRDFFPDGTAHPEPSKIAPGDGELRFTYDETPKPGSRPLRGVIAANEAGSDVFYDFEAELPGEKRPASPPAVEKKHR